MPKITIDKALLEQAISALLREALGVDNSALRQKLREALAEPAVESCGYDETTGNCTSNPCCFLPMDMPPAEPIASAWDEGYKAGIDDERMSEASIGVAGFNAKIEPARNNPYRSKPPTADVPMLTDEEFESIRKTCAYQFAEACRSGTTKAKTIMQATEAAVRQKAGL